MAATVAITKTIDIGSTEKLYYGTIALDVSYPTGGEAIDVTANERFDVLIAQPTSGYAFQWDAANQKLLAYRADYDAVADGPLVQVPDTTDLSAVTGIQFIAIGA